MQPLDDRDRRRLLSWSAILCAIPLCLAPLAGRSSFELASEQAAFNARFAVPPLNAAWNDKPVTVARDPFVPEATQRNGTWRESDVVGMHVTQGQSIGFVLPPNRGAAGTPLGEAPSAAVTGVVTGVSPRALIDDGMRVRVVGIGDAIAGSRVVQIDNIGVRLQNGTVMPLVEGNP